MRILRGLLILMMAAFAGVYWYGARPRQESTTATEAPHWVDLEPPTDPWPFRLKDAQGKTVTLEQYRGKPILLNFWASWCPPCVQELPSLLKFAAWAHKSLGLEVLAVSVDQDGWKAVNRLFEEKKFWPGGRLPLTILMNPDSGVAARYGTSQYPETFFIDRSFKVVRKFVGAQKWTSQETTEWITEHSQSQSSQ